MDRTSCQMDNPLALFTTLFDNPEEAEARGDVRASVRQALAFELGVDEKMLNLLDDEEEGPKEQPLAPVALRVPRILEQVTPSYRAREEDEESEEEDFPPPLPGSAAARAERQLLMDDFLEACPTARVLPSTSFTAPLRLEVGFVGREGRRPNTLLVTLPPTFPYASPLLHLSQPLSHPWTRELPSPARADHPGTAAAVLSGSLREWNVRWGSTLQAVVLEVLEQLAAKKRRAAAPKAPTGARPGGSAAAATSPGAAFPYLSPDDPEFLEDRAGRGAPEAREAGAEEEEDDDEPWIVGGDNVPTAELSEMGYASETVMALLDGAATLAADMLGLSSWPSPPSAPPRHAPGGLASRGFSPIIAAIPGAAAGGDGRAQYLPISRPREPTREVDAFVAARAATPGAGSDGF